MKASGSVVHWVCWLGILLCGAGRIIPAQDVTALQARLRAVAESSSLNTAGLMPWHLKLAVQVYDSTGKPSETGTIEEWWSQPDTYRVTYNFPSSNWTRVHTPAGFFYPSEGTSPPFLVDTLLRQVVDPIPDDVEVAGNVPDNRKQTIGGVVYDCIMLDQPIKNVAYPPLGLFPTYCLDHAHDLLAASLKYGNQLTTRSRVGVFQKKNVPMSMMISVEQVKAISAQTTMLTGRPTPYPEASDLTGLVAASETAKVQGGVIAGNILTKVAPHYPQSAKDRHVSGTVILHAIIGRDGHVEALTPVSVPDPDLAIAAITAVRQWIYKPYLMNGQPTEVDTTVTVNFKLGP